MALTRSSSPTSQPRAHSGSRSCFRKDEGKLSIAQSGKYVLVEFPYRGWPQSLPAALTHLRRLGMTAMRR